MLGKLLSMATVGSTLASIGLLHRLFLLLLRILILGIFSAFMLCVLLSCAFYLLYIGLLHGGIDPSVARLDLSALVLILTLALVVTTARNLQKLRFMTRANFCKNQNPFPDLEKIAMAFVDGFLNLKK